MAETAPGRQVTRRIFLRGVVQGVGMRPFLALLAQEFGISGSVRNIGSNVEIIASADEWSLDGFAEAIRARKPEMAEITGISISSIVFVEGSQPGYDGAGIQARFDGAGMEPQDAWASSIQKMRPARPYQENDSSFTILPSAPGDVAQLPPDFPVCSDCLRELHDKTNRRFRHPFISCAVCGPRYSILERAPYDRGTTSMRDYPMCPECAAEYADPADRRYHAQTVSCHRCGPHLVWQGRNGASEREEALAEAVACLKGGGIAAVKGVGGYHLACSPHDGDAVKRLRALKGRELKPFAVLFPSLQAVERCCEVSARERELLLSPARPIVLLRTKGAPFAPAVSGDAALTGAFLPYTPLQALLLEQCGELVMTSANDSGKPEIHDDGEMLAMLRRSELSGVLLHGRRIVTRLDDPVARVNAGQRQLIRRARGYAPRPVTVPSGFPHGPFQVQKGILAYGSDLKSAFCLLRGTDAYMSQYFGDMEELEVQRAYSTNLGHMRGLFGFAPVLAACDMHPGYHSSALARSGGLPLVEVQHHHAHAASVMAEHGLKGPVLGIAFDGTGYGEDGTVWGGEFLLCEGVGFVRKAHLRPVALAGGDSVAVDARKAALCYCADAGVDCGAFEGSALLAAALQNRVNTVVYSGMGRLFDAVSSILGLCHSNDYEGRCAVALENAANRAEDTGIAPLAMEFGIDESSGAILADTRPVIRAVWEASHRGQDAGAAALGFHDAVCRMAAGICRRIREAGGVNTVVLSGGTFQNGRILGGCMGLLRDAGFEVYTNNEVPCNDGGLALGQAYVAAHRRETEA